LLSFHTLFPQLNTTHPNPLSTRFGRIEAQIEVGAVRAAFARSVTTGRDERLRHWMFYFVSTICSKKTITALDVLFRFHDMF